MTRKKSRYAVSTLDLFRNFDFPFGHYLIEEELKRGELVKIKVKGYHVRKSEQYIIRRKDKAHGPVSQYTWDMLHAHFAQ